jgi:membrane-associated protein
VTSIVAAPAALAAAPALGPSWLDPRHLDAFGATAPWVAAAIIFAECGLLLGFFLPGDTLLFSAGLLSATGKLDVPFWVMMLLVPIAAIAGNLVGYWIGYKAGPAVFNKPDSRLFRQEYVDRSHEFFERYGARTIVLARFVPIVRTFATVMAGASRMRFRTYAVYSVIGGVLWGAGVLALGYYLGHIPFVRNTLEPLIEPILIAVVVLSMVPAAVELLRSRRRRGISSAPLRDEPIGPDGTAEDAGADGVRPVSGGRHRVD